MPQPTDEELARAGFHSEQERAVLRQIIALLEPLSPEQRQHTARVFFAREAGERRFREIFGESK